MLKNILNNLTNKNLPENTKTTVMSNKDIANFLKTSPEAIEAFEKAYEIASLNDNDNNFFKKNSKEVVAQLKAENLQEYHIDLVDRIVNELMEKAEVWEYIREEDSTKLHEKLSLPINTESLVKNEDISLLPEYLRPELTGHLIKKEIGEDSAPHILYMLNRYLETGDKTCYHMFRQGLDILDLDPITYKIIGTNANSIGNWLPELVESNKDKKFFKIPSTKILKVPLPLLQLTRLDYMNLTATTKEIVDKFTYKAFDLDDTKDYFVKTGTYSSKFDFRNAKVTKGQEVHELGEYLLFIHFQALQMASPLSTPTIYGVSTTNEWVVREFIEDKENNPCIYHGLPLHTEFRVFIDCDSKEVLSIENYWKPEVMEKRFNEKRGSGIDDKHDAITYLMNKDRLCQRYEDNKNLVISEVEKLLPDLNLKGQWSLDIMLNDEDFWLIDMAIAENSAYYDSVPVNKRIKSEENWIPKLEG